MRRTVAVCFALTLSLSAAVRAVEPVAPRVAWPEISSQLAAAHAPAGSALERLIRDNQDFQQLRPEEANDRIGIPLWLRVLWRKAHPEGIYSAHDPSGGYPRILNEAAEWMRAHPSLRPGPRERDVAPGEIPGEIPELGRVSAGGDLRISGLQSRPRSESDIRVNPWNPQQIVAASNNLDGFTGRLAVQYSTDGGGTWGQTTLPIVSGDDYHGDPTVGWTSDGSAWAVAIGISGTRLNALRLRAYRSTDGGATWTFDGTPSARQSAADKEILAVDAGAGSPYRDRLYLTWHNGAKVYVARRTTAGWQAPVQVSGSETNFNGIGGEIATNAAGDVIVAWPSVGNRRLLVARSTDGGATFSAPVLAATSYVAYDISIPSFASRNALITSSLGAYRTATSNLAHLAWTDLSGEPGCSVAQDEPGTDVSSPCKTRVWIARSTDGGASWSTPRKLADGPATNDQFLPRLTVDPTTGTVAVVYYDTVEDPGRTKANVYYQSSGDGGLTWSAALKLTSAPTDETVAGTDFANQYGDYIGLSGFLGRFLPSWTDRRDGAREEIWTAPIIDP